MKKLTLLLFIASLAVSCGERHEKLAPGPYEGTWESLSRYGQAPEWFRDVKFGIWAHWGPQCQPEQGDWYARKMYMEGDDKFYGWHVANYGHPSEFGFKDVINEWKGDRWDPERLMALYKRAGAQYFFKMGNHHDNFDLWDSPYQHWNSTNMGPKCNIVGEWERVARANGMRFGVSFHSAHAWTWYEVTQRHDKEGQLAGVAYDGHLTKDDGKGLWWEGYDPQELYVQNHALSEDSWEPRGVHNHWAWEEGVSIPNEAYCQNFFDRVADAVNRYKPDLVYYDDTGAPLWPVSDQGLRTIAHIYNKSTVANGGTNQAVVFGKILTDEQKNALVWDVEKGVPDQIQEKPWQTCTCLGNWHYMRSLYDNDGYKSAATVVRMLVDIVSKNGNMLLSVPMRGDGTIDDKEEAILESIAAWMAVNGEGVFETRPWTIFGEGPVAGQANPISRQGFNEGRHKGYTAEDVRFVTKGKTLYAHVMAWPENNRVVIRSLAEGSELYGGQIARVELLGSADPLSFKRTKEGLVAELPAGHPNDISFVLKID
ncbi:MAG: alpha-L-fucosidase [Rikenellaceae bacterium]|nr:alpha-L-fucosidase [Rikenellaceae bacterium]